MRSLLILLITALLSLWASACGDAGKSTKSSADAATTSTASATTSTPSYTRVDSDKDNDVGAPYDDTNNDSALDYGHAASSADKQAVTALVKRYYTIAATDDGAQACPLIVSGLSKAVAEDYGHGSAGPSYLSSGTTCQAVMTLLFKHNHDQLAYELAKLEVPRVRLIGHNGIAILRFGALEREISVSREGHTWKLETLLDTELP